MTALCALLVVAAVLTGAARRPASAAGRLRPGAVARVRARARRGAAAAPAGDDPITLALAIDLLAACLEAGVPMPAALAAASTVADPATADALVSTAVALGRGAEAQGWSACEARTGLAPVVRICRRVGVTGATAADDLRRFATERRRGHQAERRRRAQRASVWVVLPLGFCFLPAFLLLTVAPVVAALVPGLR
jgi:pilus assembly protein TadC